MHHERQPGRTPGRVENGPHFSNRGLSHWPPWPHGNCSMIHRKRLKGIQEMICRAGQFMGATMRSVKLGAGLCLVFACLPVAVPATELDRDRGFKVDEFGMLMQDAIRPEILKAITDGKTNQIVEISSWDGRPFAVGASASNGYLRARFEDDFLVLWLKMERRPPVQSSNLVDIVEYAAGSLLTTPYGVGRTRSKSLPGMYDGPRGNPDAFFAVCGYQGYIPEEDGWLFFESLDILVKNTDIIVVMRTGGARQDYVVTKFEDIEANKKQRAASVIPGIEKVPGIPESLLNGCMWPTDGRASIPIAPASKLAPILWPTEGAASIPIDPESKRAPIGNP